MSRPAPVPGSPRGRRAAGPLFVVLVGIAIALPILALLARSNDRPAEMASFDPAAACAGADRQMWPGSYPVLEARIPRTVAGVAPDRVDSGRFCSEKTLGSIHASGISEVRFGGGRWSVGDSSGLELGVFSAPGLTATALAEWYRTSAEASEGVAVTAARDELVAGRAGYRLELARGDSRQVIVVWPSADGRVVQSVIGLDVKDGLISEAIAAFD
jgi:hypothetical protein